MVSFLFKMMKMFGTLLMASIVTQEDGLIDHEYARKDKSD